MKRFEQSYGPDTALYKNIPLPLYIEKILAWHSEFMLRNFSFVMSKLKVNLHVFIFVIFL